MYSVFRTGAWAVAFSDAEEEHWALSASFQVGVSLVMEFSPTVPFGTFVNWK